MAIHIDHRKNNLEPSNGVLIIESSASLLLPRGETTDRPVSPEKGMIRFNNTDLSVEIYDGSSWKSLGNGSNSTVSDSDSDTKLTVENSPDEDIVRIFVCGKEVVTIDSSSASFKTEFAEFSSEITISSNGNSYVLPSSAGNSGQILASQGNGGKLFWKDVSVSLAGEGKIITIPSGFEGYWSIYSPVVTHTEGFLDVGRAFYDGFSGFTILPWATSIYSGWKSLNHLHSYLKGYKETGAPYELSGNIEYMLHGMSTFVVVTDKGEIAARSRNVTGILGQGDTTERKNLIKLSQNFFDNRKVMKVDLGAGDLSSPNRECMMVLVSGGLLYGAGYNARGSLGIGSSPSNVTTFTAAIFSSSLSVVTNAKDFSISSDDTPHTLVVVSAGSGYEIYAAGDNTNGALGVGDTTNRFEFTPVVGIPSSSLAQMPKKVICTGNDAQANTFVLTYDGKLWHAGGNEYGMSGDGTTSTHTNFVQTNPVSGAETLSAIMVWAPYFANALSFVLVDNDGTEELYAAGFNGDGQLGVNNTTNQNTWVKVLSPIEPSVDRPKKIIGASYSRNAVFILTESGKLYASGFRGQCVIGSGSDALVFVEARLPKIDGKIIDITSFWPYEYATDVGTRPNQEDFIVRAVTDKGEIIDVGYLNGSPQMAYLLDREM